MTPCADGAMGCSFTATDGSSAYVTTGRPGEQAGAEAGHDALAGVIGRYGEELASPACTGTMAS